MTAWQEGKAKCAMLHHLTADSPLVTTMQRLAGANDLESLLHVQATTHADCVKDFRLIICSHVLSCYSWRCLSSSVMFGTEKQRD